ncbi:hypothetical protein SteCoe_26215 [Stentor coeruleus]|uniref:Uncharacterized protein n=1 Tax=Stentor coeruleus TaxID=5963 RepID=A0A1R2BDF0_9CILI|nr:hypothetical protein SteCoe_26215 [Stentor coeruleus]
MGCCLVKKDSALTLELEINTKSEGSFNDISISSHHCHTSHPTVNPNLLITPNSARVRSISLTYPNTLENAFLMNSPSILRTSEVTKTVVFIASEESSELEMIKEENKDYTISLDFK